MGHREDLLIGAKRCLIEIGYGRTTTRDIVEASGANLASIGYHYGSKAALLNEALLDALADSGEEFRKTVQDIAMSEDASPVARFEEVWGRIIETYSSRRRLWLASFEVFAQVDRVPELREAVAIGLEQGREAMAELYRNIVGEIGAEVDAQTLRALGSYFQALTTGVMVQWLVDPEHAPSAADLARALQAMATINGTAPPAAQA